jgi:hypothetical protein
MDQIKEADTDECLRLEAVSAHRFADKNDATIGVDAIDDVGNGIDNVAQLFVQGLDLVLHVAEVRHAMFLGFRSLMRIEENKANSTLSGELLVSCV